MKPDPDYSHVPGDVRKRLMADLPPNFDEIHAHADIDWTADNVVLGEE